MLILATLIFIFRKLLANLNKVNLISCESKIILLTIFIFSLSLGILRYDLKEMRNGPDPLVDFVGKKVVLTGVIIDEPNITEKSDQLTVNVTSIQTGLLRESPRNDIQGKVLVVAGLFPQLK